MKITIIADDATVINAIKSVKLPFVKKNALFQIFTDAVTAYEHKQKGQKIRAKSKDPQIELIIEDA